MASPSLSATLNFVKKYPITLCAFSLLFMPSVHCLVLYFTPLLLSTAIFIVAMMSWGPSVSSGQSTTRRSTPKLVSAHREWAFHESMGIDDDEDEEEIEEEEVVALVSNRAKATKDMHKQGVTQEGKVELGVDLKPREEPEPEPELVDTDLRDDCGNNDIKSMGNANGQTELAKKDVDVIAKPIAGGVNHQALPHSVETPTTSLSVGYERAPMDNEEMLAINNGFLEGEPDPDLQGEDMGTPLKNDDDVEFYACDHSTCANNNDHVHHETIGAHKNDGGDATSHDGLASRIRDHHPHNHLQGGVSTERPQRCLQVCA
ncbi:hypothetical protein L7F22_041453 [Adiantum nelumboides]|nr:hypothetical protein [Adiantum nelumboides]